MKIEKYSADLESEVIFKGLCAHCGTCGAFCPHIQYFEDGPNAGLPYVLDSCSETLGLCYNSCPRADFNVNDMEQKVYGKNREDEALGVYEDKILVKSKKSILNALVETAFKHKIIDSMVVPKQTSKKPVNNIGEVVMSPKEIPELTGMNLKYTGPLVQGIDKAFNKGGRNIGLIGNPCHNQGATKVIFSDFNTRANFLKLKIAVMCAAGGAPGCIYCIDYAGEFSDISYSEIGQEKGTAALLIRTELGKKLVEFALKDKVIQKVSDTPNLEKITDLALKKKKRNVKNLLKLENGKIGYLELNTKELDVLFK